MSSFEINFDGLNFISVFVDPFIYFVIIFGFVHATILQMHPKRNPGQGFRWT